MAVLEAAKKNHRGAERDLEFRSEGTHGGSSFSLARNQRGLQVPWTSGLRMSSIWCCASSLA